MMDGRELEEWLPAVRRPVLGMATNATLRCGRRRRRDGVRRVERDGGSQGLVGMGSGWAKVLVFYFARGTWEQLAMWASHTHTHTLRQSDTNLGLRPHRRKKLLFCASHVSLARSLSPQPPPPSDLSNALAHESAPFAKQMLSFQHWGGEQRAAVHWTARLVCFSLVPSA